MPLRPERIRRNGQAGMPAQPPDIPDQAARNVRIEDVRPGRVVVYWMQAAPRVWWNAALNHAAAEAVRLRIPLVCVFVLAPNFPDAALRQYWFMIQGLKSCKADLARLGLKLVVLPGDPPEVLAGAARRWEASLVVTDQGYSLIQRRWRTELAGLLHCPLVEAAGETVVPVETAYPRQAWSAAVLRRPLKRLVPGFLADIDELPDVQGIPAWPGEAGEEGEACGTDGFSATGTGKARSGTDEIQQVDLDSLQVPEDLLGLLHDLAAEPGPVPEIQGGHDQAVRVLDHFLEHHLHHYGTEHSDPGRNALSGLSPWIHFGQIGVVEIARRVLDHGVEAGRTRPSQAASPGGPDLRPLLDHLFDKAVPEEGLQAFLEELLVRRDLACNFCHYNDAHRSFSALPAWARATLLAHAGDLRPHIHTMAELEEGRTYDRVWNACQNQLRRTGTMHGYLRMYWGKKILEWSPHPEEAFDRAIHLNDKWALDGRDPNGWAGVAWCFGLHDRPWAERPVFGTVRYMNLAGLQRKFDLAPYLERWG